LDHHDHVALLRPGVEHGGLLWADFGSGGGAFTLALADLLGPDGMIYSLDRKANALREQAQAMRRRFPRVAVHYIVADYRQPLDLPEFDGIVMANTLHYLTADERFAALGLVRGYLRPGGRLVVVEYDVEESTFWLPYPLSWRAWQLESARAGFVNTRQIATRPSSHGRQFYAAVSERAHLQASGIRAS